MKHKPIALTIAGSDSGGGAGVQTDLKTFASIGVHGTSVLTCVTAQNPSAVLGVQSISPTLITAQFDALKNGLKPKAIKSGMLYSKRIVQAVIEGLHGCASARYVMDPVMVATSGAPLLKPDCVALMMRSLIPLADLITPNIAEAEALIGGRITKAQEAKEAAYAMAQKFKTPCLLKGGHLPEKGKVVDYLATGAEVISFSSAYIPRRQTHGTGCTYAAAITAYLAQSYPLSEAVGLGKQFITSAIQNSVRVGSYQALDPSRHGSS